MSDPRSDRLIVELSRDLAPVRRVPRLRTGVLAAGLAFAAMLAWRLFATGPRWSGLGSDALFTAVFAGLVMAGVGGAVAALAAGVPGRDGALRGGAITAATGLGMALFAGIFGVAIFGFEFGSPLAADAMCLRKSIGLSLLPGVVVLALVLRGWVSAPRSAAALALLGVVALGALVTHLTCAFAGPRHLLLGHVGGPVLVMALGSLPLAALLRRFAR